MRDYQRVEIHEQAYSGCDSTVQFYGHGGTVVSTRNKHRRGASNYINDTTASQMTEVHIVQAGGISTCTNS